MGVNTAQVKVQIMQRGTIVFDEVEHKYYVDGVLMQSSVTQLVGTFFSEFEAEKIATAMLAKPSFLTEARYKEYRTILRDTDRFSTEARDMVIAHWKAIADEAASLGTAMHKSIEAFYNEGRVPCPSTKEFNMFTSFDLLTKKLGFVPYKSEQIVFDTDLSLAGSVDMLYTREAPSPPLRGGRTKIWLVDWKRSKEIKTEAFGNKRGRAPFQCLQDCNHDHYSLQLNIYKYLLEKNYNMIIERMTLVILHPNQDDYLMFEVSDLQPEVQRAMEERLRQLQDN